MAETKKRERNFERAYSDGSGELAISHNDDTVLELALNSIHPDVLTRAALRYVADIVVGVGNAALKADGGTAEKAQEKMAETLKSLQDGTFKFRAASGQGGLSDEEAQEIIAAELVKMKKAEDSDKARAIVAAIYARTKKNAKGYIVRPDFNALKNVPTIRAALANASKAESNVDDILAKVA